MVERKDILVSTVSAETNDKILNIYWKKNDGSMIRIKPREPIISPNSTYYSTSTQNEIGIMKNKAKREKKPLIPKLTDE